MVKTVRDVNFNGKKVFIRVDFNVPLKNGIVQDDTRIVKAIPTLKYILDNGGKLVIVSHLGRPKGKKSAEFSLKPVAEVLQNLIGEKVYFCDYDLLETGVAGKSSVADKILKMDEKIMLLENIRFYPQEKKNDPEFSAILGSLGEIYVNDAFGTAHRAHASTCGIAEYLKPAVAGLLMEKEVEYLIRTLKSPAKPFTLILGGAKVSSKIGVIEHLIDKVDNIIIGGGMSYTFFKSMGLNIGKSLCEEEKLTVARDILEKADSLGVNFYLPKDHLVVKDFASGDGNRICLVEEIENDEMGVDIGPKTLNDLLKVLDESKTIVWNGPVGVFETEMYSKGTKGFAKKMAELCDSKSAVVIVGGGDTASAVNKYNVAEKISHVSTGGGASLELMEGKELPGLAALDK